LIQIVAEIAEAGVLFATGSAAAAAVGKSERTHAAFIVER
jgi:hypothetical protein